jgi:hypothetical protein
LRPRHFYAKYRDDTCLTSDIQQVKRRAVGENIRVFSDFERRYHVRCAHIENDESVVPIARDESQPLVSIHQQPMVSLGAGHVNPRNNPVTGRVDFNQLIARLDVDKNVL